MKRIVWTLAGVLGAYVAVALLFDLTIGLSQPELQPGRAEGVLHTFDAQGQRHETRLAVVDDGDTVWVQSGHHFRGWYDRLLLNPDVELVRAGEVRAYRAVPVDTPEAEARVRQLLRERSGGLRFAVIRVVLLFADIKPVRLDPR